MGKQLIIFCAGKGTRMGKSSEDPDKPPKPLIPLFDYYNPEAFNPKSDPKESLYHAYIMNTLQVAQTRYDGFIIVLAKPYDRVQDKKQKMIVDYIERFYHGWPGCKPVAFAYQDMERFPGTLGAMKAAIPFIDGDVSVVMPDDLHHKDHYKEMAEIDMNAVIVDEVEDPRRFGTFKVKQNHGHRIVTDLVEKPQEYLGRWMKSNGKFDINAGFYNFKEGSLDKLLGKVKKNPERGEFELTDLLKLMVQSGELVAIESSGFYPIGTREELIINAPKLKLKESEQPYFLSHGILLSEGFSRMKISDYILHMAEFLG